MSLTDEDGIDGPFERALNKAAREDGTFTGCRIENDGRLCVRTSDHSGSCRFLGQKHSARLQRARELLLSDDDHRALRDLVALMSVRELTSIDVRAKDVIERLLGKDRP